MSRLVMAVVTATLAVPCARADEAEDKAVAFLTNPKNTRARGKLTRDTTKPDKPVVKVELINPSSQGVLQADDVKLLAAFKSLTSLDLTGVEVEDGVMKDLAKLTTLKELVLPEAPLLKDAGLKELAALKNLTSLRIHHRTNVTAEGIAALQKELPKCKIIKK